jgi:DNA-binding GntR family transcriptional regulator
MSESTVLLEKRARGEASKKNQVYEILKNRIIQNDLKPQQYLNELEICEQLGISKTPVREALQHLERDRLVVIVPSKGCFVTNISLDLIREVFEIREVLECAAARFAARMPVRTQFQELLEGHESFNAVDDAGVRNSLLSGYQIHQIIIDASGNSFLSGFYQAVLAHILRIRIYFLNRFESQRLHETCDEHRRVLRAIIEGNADEAEKAMREHLEHSLISIGHVMLGKRMES